MASTRIIEQDHGTYAGLVTHLHNGLRRRLLSAGHCVRFGRHGAVQRFGWQPGSRDRTGNPVMDERDVARAGGLRTGDLPS
jgi:hypothetical protein